MNRIWQQEQRNPGAVFRELERQDRNFANATLAGVPDRWARRIYRQWMGERALRNPSIPEVRRENIAKSIANKNLVSLVDRLQSFRLPLDAGDDEICKKAEEVAECMAGLSRMFRKQKELREAMSGYASRMGVEPPLNDPEKTAHVMDLPAIARMVDPQWWRRKLRVLHAKVVEGSAIKLGYVNKTSDCYVSDESLQRRIQQNRRNDAMLQNTVAINERGDEYTLAELSAKGISNKAIRRVELMTRIAGFERIAKDCGHVGLFITLTCPSRMHRWRTLKSGKVMRNDRYDGTLPDAAQSYLSKAVWSKVRAKWQRLGIRVYGFRIVEPNHDGTPHWHMLFFVEARHEVEAMEVLTDYALRDSPDEPGAREHRCKVVKIDWSRGSAAGYIAKYVAKNIDGYKVDKDLLGNDAIESSARVEAWAATWRIRQFQQIGGPSVGVWRELRRVKSLPDDAPQEMVRAWTAANRVEDGEEVRRADWAEYVQAQGGVTVGRNGAAVRMERQEVDEVGRYYEQRAPVPVGVSADHFCLLPVLEDEILSDEQVEQMAEQEVIAPLQFKRFARTVVAKSLRYVWEIVNAKARASVDVVLRIQAMQRHRINKFMQIKGWIEEARQAGNFVVESLLQVRAGKVLAGG